MRWVYAVQCKADGRIVGVFWSRRQAEVDYPDSKTHKVSAWCVTAYDR